jgi:prolyl 4-hydroxylase
MSEDLDALATRAKAGDLRALATLGRVLLTGDGVRASPLEGLALLRDASQQGDGEAAAVLAMVAAFGVLEAQDLPHAVQLLEASAERGWAPAQEQLRILARAEGNDWPALRRRVDIAALCAPPPRRVLCEQPRLRVIEKFATHAECDWLIERARGRLQRAEMYRGSAESHVSDTRTNTESHMTLKALDVVSCVLIERLSAAAGLKPAFCEMATVLHYEPGQRFGPHADFYGVHTPALREEIRARGQRIATFLLYLNDDYEGGETEFIKADIRYKGRKGDALLFINVTDDGAPDRSTIHQGLPTTRGEKWLFSQWIRSKPINVYWTPDAELQSLDANWLRQA